MGKCLKMRYLLFNFSKPDLRLRKIEYYHNTLKMRAKLLLRLRVIGQPENICLSFVNIEYFICIDI